MFTDGDSLLIVQVMDRCSIREFEAIEDSLTGTPFMDMHIHKWCYLTGEPPAPKSDELFTHAHIMAHGGPTGCDFCDNGRCLGTQTVISDVCSFLANDAVVFAACCWCGAEETAIQIACACEDRITEIVGPTGMLTEQQMHQVTSDFYCGLASGLQPKQAAAKARNFGDVALHYFNTSDVETDECKP